MNQWPCGIGVELVVPPIVGGLLAAVLAQGPGDLRQHLRDRDHLQLRVRADHARDIELDRVIGNALTRAGRVFALSAFAQFRGVRVHRALQVIVRFSLQPQGRQEKEMRRRGYAPGGDSPRRPPPASRGDVAAVLAAAWSAVMGARSSSKPAQPAKKNAPQADRAVAVAREAMSRGAPTPALPLFSGADPVADHVRHRLPKALTRIAIRKARSAIPVSCAFPARVGR